MALWRELDPLKPVDTDLISQGDDELRALKQTLWDQWPNFSAVACTPNVQEINSLVGINTSQTIQQQIDEKSGYVGWGGWYHNDPAIVTSLGTVGSQAVNIRSSVSSALLGNNNISYSGATGSITPVQIPQSRIVLHGMITLIPDIEAVLRVGFRNSLTPAGDFIGPAVSAKVITNERSQFTFSFPTSPVNADWFIAVKSIGGPTPNVSVADGGFWLEYK